MDRRYYTPFYDPAVDDEGNLINPGDILFYKENYSGTKDSTSINGGIALTFSFPLDKRFQRACLKSAKTEQKIRQQKLSNLRLDFELARLKNCGELRIAGIQYSKDSPYYSICSDVLVTPKRNQTIEHRHPISSSSE